jgi:hypothetical protein
LYQKEHILISGDGIDIVGKNYPTLKTIKDVIGTYATCRTFHAVGNL